MGEGAQPIPCGKRGLREMGEALRSVKFGKNKKMQKRY